MKKTIFLLLVSAFLIVWACDAVHAATATPTYTSTRTRTSTAISTKTITQTVTKTVTKTVTQTITLTATPTYTFTSTQTTCSQCTITPSITPTVAATQTLQSVDENGLYTNGTTNAYIITMTANTFMSNQAWFNQWVCFEFSNTLNVYCVIPRGPAAALTYSAVTAPSGFYIISPVRNAAALIQFPDCMTCTPGARGLQAFEGALNNLLKANP